MKWGITVNFSIRVNEIEQLLYKEAPKALAYEWDNIGLLCGKRYQTVTGVYLCLDVTPAAIEEAASCGCNLIVSHHPFIFSKIKNINYETYFGTMFRHAIMHEMNIISMHTNMDKAKNGINQLLAEKLGLTDIKPLIPEEEGTGMGRVGNVNPIEFDKFCKFVSEKLNSPIKIKGENEIIKKVAVVGGSGFEFEQEAIKQGCDVIVTGDVKYHQAVESQIKIIDAGHYPTEICVLEIFENILKPTGVKIVKSTIPDVFRFVM